MRKLQENREINMPTTNEQKYCLSTKQNVKISLHNGNGNCVCLNCTEQKCKGVLCEHFKPLHCTDMVDYLKGVNPICTQCRNQR